MSWNVVIPSARATNLIRSVASVFRAHPGLDPRRVVVVDDGAREEAERHLPSGIRWVDGAKPFVFARNVNRGVSACPDADPVVIMGDDVEVLTPGGFDLLAHALLSHEHCGLISAGVAGVVGNPRQKWDRDASLRWEGSMLVFICVAIPRAVWERVGVLDEQFTGYGCEDEDYSWRVKEAGYALGTQHACAVRHDGTLPSTFRTRPDVALLFAQNRERLHRKWALLQSRR